ncbi:MAG: Stp1/IreP family PP2C-type Ser/Thr phosphatase [Actinomycetota bacterium]|nr:MAG: Stp1/IreP family PP2C-type Ser/Thr phosphatase [Actinomycetota bacterium]
MISLSWGVASDTGRIRKNNQDSYLATGTVFAVADGMGGHVGGEIASKIAIDVFKDAFSGSGENSDIVEVVRQANSAILSRASKEPKLAGMGTTLCLLSVTDSGKDQLDLINIGDSRGYLFRAGELYQLTDDHTLVSEMLKSGDISKDQAGSHRAKHILTRALGVDSQVEIDHWTIDPMQSDLYLLCSDGLTNEMADPEISQVLAKSDSAEAMAQELVDTALANGGSDNVTCIVVQVESVVPAPLSSGAEKTRIVELPSQTKLRERLQSATHSYGADMVERDRFIAVSQLQKEKKEDEAKERRTRDNAGKVVGPAVRVNPVNAVISSSTARSPELLAIPMPLPKRATERRFHLASLLRSFVFLVILVVVLALGVSAIGIYANHSYYVGLDHSNVAIYKGRPGGLLWYNPSLVRDTQLTTQEVAPYHLPDLTKGIAEPSLSAANTYINNLLNESRQIGTLSSNPPPTTAANASPTTTVAGASG